MSKTAKISGLLLIFALAAALFPDIVQPGFAQTIGNAERLARGQCAEFMLCAQRNYFRPIAQRRVSKELPAFSGYP